MNYIAFSGTRRRRRERSRRSGTERRKRRSRRFGVPWKVRESHEGACRWRSRGQEETLGTPFCLCRDLPRNFAASFAAPCEVGTRNEQQFERQPLQYLARYFSSSMAAERVSFFPLICPIINPRDGPRENCHGILTVPVRYIPPRKRSDRISSKTFTKR